MKRSLPKFVVSSFTILLLASLITQVQGPQITLAQFNQPQNPSAGFFGGLSGAARGLFEGIQHQFNNWFYGGAARQEGGAELPHPTSLPTPTSGPTPTPGGPTPTPGPYLNIGDLIQLDASFGANCIPDRPPDELHVGVTDRSTYCDWDMPGGPDVNFPSMPEECEGHWRTTPITCLTDYWAGYQPGNPQGCMGQSVLRTCLLKVTENGYQMHWRLEMTGDLLSRHGNGERAGDHLLGDGVLIETTFFGVHPDASGALHVGYWWPPGRYFDGNSCSHYNNCFWGSDGTCSCACDIFGNAPPYNFVVPEGTPESATAAMAFQTKPDGNSAACCGGAINGCFWENHEIPGYIGAPSEYTAISSWRLDEAIDITTPLPTPAPVPVDPVPCNPPPEAMAGCDTEDRPTSVGGWLSSGCEFPPDWDDPCLGLSTAPDPLWRQCPFDIYTADPRDLCWGLYDPWPGNYAPSQVGACTGGLSPADRQTAEWGPLDEADGFECRYQVPAQNVIAYEGEECNQTAHLGRHYRMCAPYYAPPYSPAEVGIGVNWLAYIRKLNGCNEYFEGYRIPETNVIGLPGNEPPPSHTGYCNNESPLCNTTDGMRCTNIDGPNVCRKAIRVETFEVSHRTRTPPPAGAFTANCLIRETEGDDLRCGDFSCSGGNTCVSGIPATGANCGDGVYCCSDCNADGTCPSGSEASQCGDGTYCCPDASGTACGDTEGCNPLAGDLDDCDYPILGACDTSMPPDPLCSTDPDSDQCAGLDACCKGKSHCAFPMPARGDPTLPDSGDNPARNCAVYEWTERQNIYTVEYLSNVITVNLEVKNLSSHPVPQIPYDPDDPDPNSTITISVDLPDFLDYRDSEIILSDPNPANPDLNPTLIPDLSTEPAPNTHGGRIEWVFDQIPAANNPENGNSEFIIRLDIVPADIDLNGVSHFSDHEITLGELDHYTNSLISDDRLANLEFRAEWVDARSVELLSFWIGQGVLSTAEPPCKYGTAPCYTDAEALPYGWPNLGVVAQDWGGSEDINADPDTTWSNPFADIYGPRYESDPQRQGVYRDCNPDPAEEEWYNTGIDIIPPGEVTWSPAVFSTHAGYVTHAGPYDEPDAYYPGRGVCVEVQSTSDDDCLPNFLTRHCNLAPGSLRVQTGEYIPRHKLLGLMGDSGTPGYVHLHYTIREGNPSQNPNFADVPDNNVGLWHSQDADPQIDPPFSNTLTWEEPDDINMPYDADTCYDNPYRCHVGDPLDLTSSPEEVDLHGSCTGEYPPRFFCTIRRRDDELRSCYYANP